MCVSVGHDHVGEQEGSEQAEQREPHTKVGSEAGVTGERTSLGLDGFNFFGFCFRRWLVRVGNSVGMSTVAQQASLVVCSKPCSGMSCTSTAGPSSGTGGVQPWQ